MDRLHAAATAGEWEVSDRVDFWSVRAAEGETAFDDGSACDEYRAQCSVPTRDAIVALHNAWPAISARLRAAEAEVEVEVERLRGALRGAIEELDTIPEDPKRFARVAGMTIPLVRGGLAKALLPAKARAALGEP